MESKFGKTVNQVIYVGIFTLPLLIFLYFLWLHNTKLYIFLENYKIILYGCYIALWISFFLILIALMARKYIALGVTLFLIIASCLSITGLSLTENGPTLLDDNLPSRLDAAQLGENKYHLTTQRETWGHLRLKLYKCGNYDLHCEQLPFDREDHHGAHFVIDTLNREVNVVDGRDSLLYTYGDNPRYYDQDSKTQLKDHFYYLSMRCSEMANYICRLFTYSLYECSLNNIMCKQLPFRFEREYVAYLYLEPNEITNEINIYNNASQTLIYSYSEHPSCYVEGCEILQESKP